MLFNLVELYGLTGRFGQAREAAALSRSIALDLGHVLEAAATSQASGPMERLAGNLEMAETELRADYETLMQAGEQRLGSTTAGFLAHVLCDRGKLDEALTMTEEAEALSAQDDYLSQVLWQSARARALAMQNPRVALELASEAVARAGASGDPVSHGEALLSLSEVHETAARWQQALGSIEQAIGLFQGKGATAYVERAERRREKVRAMRNESAGEGNGPGA
jgi:tetratricopeptide (TPR) repeat protein